MKKRIGFISILIGLLFFLNSSQYLSWFYILGNNYAANVVDLVGQILGKLFQAIGIIVFCFYGKFYKNRPNRILEFSILIAINFVITVFAIAPPLRGFCHITGLVMNIVIGMLYALYVSFIIELVPKKYYATSFGLGIGISCVFSYILYAFDKDYSFMTDIKCLYFYGMLAFFIILYLVQKQKLIISASVEIVNAESTQTETPNINIIISGILFTLISITYVLGYFTPSGDITDFHISVEVMRLVYFISLVVAGVLNDRSRRLGNILSLLALTFAFSMPLMRDFSTGVYITWIISYFAGGFITICRAILFLDIAKDSKKTYLAPVGIAIGRAGEPIGMFIRIKLEANNMLLLFTISFFFAITIVLFTIMFINSNRSTINYDDSVTDFHRLFTTRYELSPREIQILDEILARKQNKEIAASLYITEATVKFHVKNLLAKTKCKNRNELIKLYNASNSQIR